MCFVPRSFFFFYSLSLSSSLFFVHTHAHVTDLLEISEFFSYFPFFLTADFTYFPVEMQGGCRRGSGDVC